MTVSRFSLGLRLQIDRESAVKGKSVVGGGRRIPELARKVTEDLEVDFQTQNSWRLELEHDDIWGDDDVETYLVWITDKAGKEKRYYREPAGLWRKLRAFFLSLLPIEDQL